MWWLSLASCIVGAVFTWVLGKQFAERGRPHQLVWTVGLAMFTVATLGEFYGAVAGWTVPVYKVYYFAGVALPGLLGMGTVYLMTREKPLWGHVYSAAVLIVMVVFLGAVATAELDVDVLAASGIAPVHGDIMPDSARSPYSILLSAIGGTVMVLGALYSWLRHGLKYNAFIFSGGLLFVISGMVTSRLGLVEIHSLANLIGIGLIFAGVMAAARAHRPAARAEAAS